MKVFFIGDIVGRSGRRVIADSLSTLFAEHKWDLCIANAENAAGGKGLTRAIADELMGLGIDALTMGNHTWDNKEIFNFIDDAQHIIRPYNYPRAVPGRGYTVLDRGSKKIGIVNLSGQAFMGPYDCPFAAIDRVLAELIMTDHIIVDFHAEATAEKVAMAYYLDGRVSAVVGTHTHIQTADERVMPGGTLYITDVGMSGPVDSVLGMEIKPVIQKFTTKLPQRFSAASGPGQMCAVLLDFDNKAIKRLSITSE